MVGKYIKEDEFSSVKESGGIVADNLSINSVIRPEADASEIEAEAGGLGAAEDRALRPKTLKDYIGQEDVKSQLEIALAAAKKRGEALDHVLIFGPPGLGAYIFRRLQVLLWRKKAMLPLF